NILKVMIPWKTHCNAIAGGGRHSQSLNISAAISPVTVLKTI
ncbi:hypothetical protein CLAFUW4_12673, partial [Fulvia fulva]